MRVTPHPDVHLVSRIGVRRAAVPGANDGIASTASLIVGVAAGFAKISDMLIAGIAGLVAGAMSMAPTAGIGALVGSTLFRKLRPVPR